MAVKVVEGEASHVLNMSEVRAWMVAALCFQLSAWTLVLRACCTHARVCTVSPLLIHLFVLRLSFILRLIHPASLARPASLACPASLAHPTSRALLHP